jgi:hypothetical protein
MDAPASPSPLNPYKDRSGALIGFGILEIILGCGCLLMILLMVLGLSMASQTADGGPGARMAIPMVGIYGAVAGVFVWLGIGSIMRRRWARALSLILSWSWLGVGIFSMAVVPFIMRRSLSAASQGGHPMPEIIQVVAMTVAMLFLGFFMVVIPGVMVLFYRSPHVKATCEARDPSPCWTDAAPLPLLGVSCGLWVGAVGAFFIPMGYGIVPFFGVYLTDIEAAPICFALAGLWVWLGWMFYKLKPAAWPILVCALVLVGTSSAFTLSRIDVPDLYRKLGYSESMIAQIQKQGIVTAGTMTWWSTAWMIPVFGYLIWAKRFFPKISKGSGDTTVPPHPLPR